MGSEDEETQAVEAHHAALDNAVRAAAWDETRKEVASLTAVVQELVAAFKARGLVVALSVLCGTLIVLLAMVGYYALISGPAIARLNRLEDRVDQLEIRVDKISASIPTTTVAPAGNAPVPTTTTTTTVRSSGAQSSQVPSNQTQPSNTAPAPQPATGASPATTNPPCPTPTSTPVITLPCVVK